MTIEERDTSGNSIRSNKYCENMPKNVNTSNVLIIKSVDRINPFHFIIELLTQFWCVFNRFESDYSLAERGFHLEYEIQGCGGMLNKPEGSFTSPNYPKPYPRNTHCQWIIEVEYGHLVEISFLDFDFETSDGCAQDGLIVSAHYIISRS